jgi:ATP-dependent helicase HepA
MRMPPSYHYLPRRGKGRSWASGSPDEDPAANRYNAPRMWRPGDRLTHRGNPELGPGRVQAIHGRRVEVQFPEAGSTLVFAADADALVPFAPAPGGRARLPATGEVVTLAAAEDGGRAWRLADGRRVPADDLWPPPPEASPWTRLARGEVDAFEDFQNRLDALHLERLRQAGGLGSFLGGRIRLYPHQLYVAERAAASDPVRWLLADEVGLGKTVEACLVLNRLIHTGRAGRVLVAAPETLTVQWLGELWRKHHQVFALLDDKRLADVARDHGADFNPFDVHRRAIVSLELLAERRRLAEQAVEAGIDLLVVDEAHRLKRPPGHPGNPAYRAVAPIAALGRSVLLLTATPLEDDAHGFFRLLQLLRPEELPEGQSFEERLARREPLPPCTSATRRADVGGLPPRVPVPVETGTPADWEPLLALERRARSAPIPHAAARRPALDRIARALASPAAFAAVTPPAERGDAELAAAERADPRLAWLLAQLTAWRRAGEKTLVFVAHRETLERIQEAIEKRAALRAGIFHEGLETARRDIEVAQFRLSEGPPVLISTEAGGEGRNFEFCRRLVLFDLPWNPAVVEQRIGRLDRIGRDRPTEIVYFRPPGGLAATLATLYEEIGLFREPLAGLERELASLARAVEEAALAGPGDVPPAAFAGVLDAARAAHGRVLAAAYHELHRDPYGRELAPGILARVPPDLEPVTQSLVERAASRFGFLVERESGRRTFRFELGYESLVESLPGVPPGSRYLGTFDREEGVENEALDFFANGHPLVEGVLAELEDGPRGRVGLFQVDGDVETFGLLALYRRTDGYEAVAVDSTGRRRPGLAAWLSAPNRRREPAPASRWTGQAGWAKTIRRLAAALPAEPPQAVAAFRVRKRRSTSIGW